MSRLLFRRLRQWTSAHTLAARGGPHAVERVAEARAAHLGRRRFLQGLGAATAAAFAPGCATSRPVAATIDRSAPRIAVIGGGLAGLTCAWRLANAGLHATVYEASSRVGGRVLTRRGMAEEAPEVPVELGASFIDTHHHHIQRLIRDIGLTLIDTTDDDLGRVFYVGGQRYSEEEMITRFEPVAAYVQRLRDQLGTGGERISYASPGGAEALDQKSVAELIAESGGDEVIQRALAAVYTAEYGVPLDELSALTMVLELGTEDIERISPIGVADEVLRLAQGNDSVPRSLAEGLSDRVALGRTLEAVSQRADGTYSLAFAGAGGVREVVADVVVFALPFRVLREVELRVELPAVKRRCIDELGFGTNAKLMVPFATRFWRDAEDGGESISDTGIQATWDETLSRPGTTGVICAYAGAEEGIALGEGSVEAQVGRFIGPFAATFPGAREALRGPAVRQHWPSVPTVRGSYSCYTVGQWTTIGGAEGEPVGRLLFCGEHTSPNYQGYMNGAVATGEAAASAIFEWSSGRQVSQGPPLACRRLRLPA